jgi:acetyltransferase-like isoleucine patch superfamily enzyme
MITSDVINRIMFDYSTLTDEEIGALSATLSNKLKRWLGAHHPDNRIRKIFFAATNIEIGEGTVINQNFIVSDDYLPLLKIGKRVAISPNVTIICASGPNNSFLNNYEYVKKHLVVKKEIVIEDDVWIGANAVLLPGVRIGEAAIIGACSVVTSDVPSHTIAAGNPARSIRKI